MDNDAEDGRDNHDDDGYKDVKQHAVLLPKPMALGRPTPVFA
jgi:hypothetical protein